MTKKGRTKAQERYDKRNPVISFRVDKELKEQLDKIKNAEDKSYRDLIEDIVKDRKANIKNAWKNGFEEGVQNTIVMYTGFPVYSKKEAEEICDKSGYRIKPNTNPYKLLDEGLFKTDPPENLYRILDHFLGMLHKECPPTFGNKREDAPPTWEQMDNYEPGFRWYNSAHYNKDNN
ncbi:MAG: ribbon-helix-helix domain-containing protein [Candidatus Woesearchaeota archaeon]